jgi:DNA-binding SARP family transcriptional activator
MSAAVEVHLCGRLALCWAGESLEGALPGRQGRLLLAYLVLHRDRAVRRDELAEVLWAEDGPPPGGDALLAPPLSRLRRALGPGRLEGRAELSLALPDDTWVDWEVAHAQARAARAALDAGDPQGAAAAAREALAIADGGLLPGLEASWIDERRAELAGLRIDALEALAVAGATLGGAALPEAERAARAAVEAAPFRESARAALLLALRAQGNVAEALVAYEELRTLLREELGTSPGPALAALHEELLRADLAPAPAPAPAPPPPTARARAARPPGGLPDRLTQAVAAPLFGRDAALAALRRALAAARAGEPQVAFVSGEGGIGKTRVVAELARGAGDAQVLYGRCDEEDATPFGLWLRLLSAHLDTLDDPALAALVGEDAGDLGRLLPEVRRRLPDLPPPPALDPETERFRLFAAVVRVLCRMGERAAVLVVLDDLHWADRSSLLLLREVVGAPTLGPALVVGTFREEELGPRHPLGESLAAIERERPALRVRLEGLGDADVAALAGAEDPAGRLAGERVRAIREETGGNPFFVKQLVRHLGEGGTGQDVPAGLRDVIARRVARLPDGADGVLRVAALVGREFRLELVAEVAGRAEDEVLDHLDAAVRAGLVAELDSAPGRYLFAHALLRTTLEDELTATRRARVHRRIGEVVEQRLRGDDDGAVADLARHFAAAGPAEVDRAVLYGLRAADQATERLAYEEAVELVAGALAARERDEPVEPAERARLLMRLAEALGRAGRWDDARDAYARAAGAARDAEAPALFARASLGHAGGLWERFGQEDRASAALLEEALAVLPADDAPLRAQLLARLSIVLYYLPGAERRCAVLADEALAIARRLDDGATLLLALSAQLYAHWRPGEAALRLHVADEAVAVAGGLGQLADLAHAHAWRAIALLELCRLPEADADLARHAELAERLQQPELLSHAAATRSMRALQAGDWAAGEAAAHETLAQRRPTPMALQFFGVEMIVLLGEQLRLAEVLDHFERLVREIGGLPGWRTPLAWAFAQTGRREEALAELAPLRADDWAGLPRDANYDAALAIVAHVADELGDAELAAEVEERLRPYADTWVVLGPGPATLGPVAYSLGLCGLLRGADPDAVVADLELAIERCERMEALPYGAHARAVLAEALDRRGAPGDAERATGLRDEAAAVAARLGMPRLERRLAAAVA